MAIKIYFRRFVALLLCCVLVGSSFPVEAFATDPVTAASLAITGGQLAGAGLSGEAALSLAGPVGAVVGVTLGALGVNAYVSKAAQEAGKTRTRFVLDKLVLWGAQAGYTQEQLYSKIAQGISVAADGTIQLSHDVAEMVSQFGSWAFQQEDTVVPSLSGSPTYSVGDVALHSIVLNQSYAVTMPHFTPYQGRVPEFLVPTRVSPSAVYAVTCSDGNLYFGNASGSNNLVLSFDVDLWGSFGMSLNSRIGRTDFYSVFQPISSEFYVSVGYPTTSLSISEVKRMIEQQGVTVGSASSYDEVFTGTPDSWAENKDVLNPSAEDTPVVLNPDLLNPIIDSLADGQQATMSIIDYLEALQDAWDHALDDVQTAIGTITDSLTGIQQQIAVPQEAVANPTVTNPSVTPETTPVLDPSTVDPGTAVTGLSFDLTQIFPFCIPFDIYDMLATLSATPEAPVYHVHYEGPYNIVIDFTVDLSPWNSVAAVLRTVELLAFCIGLAYVTRSMFIRS